MSVSTECYDEQLSPTMARLPGCLPLCCHFSSLQEEPPRPLYTMSATSSTFDASSSALFKMSTSYIDEDLWNFYKIGLGVGIVFITTLQLLFPGKDDDVTTLQQAKEEPPTAATTPTATSSSSAEEKHASANHNNNNNNKASSSEDDAGFNEPANESTTRDNDATITPPMNNNHSETQQQTVSRRATKLPPSSANKQEEEEEKEEEAAPWTPHGQLNMAVYVILISATVYILNQEYGGILVEGFIRFFPREAKLLNL